MAYNILIIDDSFIVRSVLKKTLTLANVDVEDLFEADNGVEALEIMAGMSIDLIFTDINMPKMGGVELVQTMHKDSLIKDIPVVVISTEGSITRVNEMTKLGVQAYLRKPFTPEGIKKVVEDILGDKSCG